MEYEQKDALAAIGGTLVVVQMAERMIKFCTGYVLLKDGSLSLEKLASHKVEESRRAVGHFLEQLRQRVQIEPAFDQHLRDFLDLRNKLAHNLSEVPGLGFQSSDEIAFTVNWAGKLSGLALHVHNVFMGLARAWQEQIGMRDDFADNESFQEIDAQFKPLVDRVFAAKQLKV